MAERQPRIGNRAIIVTGLVFCILVAVVAAWLLGAFARGTAPS